MQILNNIKILVGSVSQCLAKPELRHEKSYMLAVYVEIGQRQHHSHIPSSTSFRVNLFKSMSFNQPKKQIMVTLLRICSVFLVIISIASTRKW